MPVSHRGLLMLTLPAPDSNLMRSLVNTIKLKLSTPEHKPILSTATFEHIANLSFEQLTTLRHRGAFSTVTSTFAACCQACVDPKMDATSSQFLVKWLEVCLILSSVLSTQLLMFQGHNRMHHASGIYYSPVCRHSCGHH